MSGHQQAVVLVTAIIVGGIVLCSMFGMFSAWARAKYGYAPAATEDEDSDPLAGISVKYEERSERDRTDG